MSYIKAPFKLLGAFLLSSVVKFEILTECNHLEYIGVNGKIILKWIYMDGSWQHELH
jgi:hypothetical protein